jgi:hypothetical protein
MADSRFERFARLPQARKFHAPLLPGDSATETFGCRHTNPEICRKNGMLDICAFVRSDGRCYAPPASWPKKYQALTQQSGAS